VRDEKVGWLGWWWPRKGRDTGGDGETRRALGTAAALPRDTMQSEARVVLRPRTLDVLHRGRQWSFVVRSRDCHTAFAGFVTSARECCQLASGAATTKWGVG
jgi:hypothetical protein